MLVYHDDESLYLEVSSKESGVVRFSFEMLQALGEIVVEDELEEGQPRRIASLACQNFILAGFVDKALSPGPSKGRGSTMPSPSHGEVPLAGAATKSSKEWQMADWGATQRARLSNFERARPLGVDRRLHGREAKRRKARALVVVSRSWKSKTSCCWRAP